MDEHVKFIKDNGTVFSIIVKSLATFFKFLFCNA